MTLTDMRPGDMGILLTVPHYLLTTQLHPGGHVRLITTNKDLALIDADGVRLALSLPLARQMILARYRD